MVCKGLQEYTRVDKGILGYRRIYQGLQGYTRVYNGIHGLKRVYYGLQRYTMVYRGILMVYKGMLWFKRVH